jgi:hypothetical protein
MHDLGSAHPATRPAPDRHPWLHARTDPENGDRSSRIELHPPETGRSPTQTPSGRRAGRVCPPVLSLGGTSPCEPLVSNLGNRSCYAPPIPAPKPRMKGYQPTVSTVGSPPNLTPAPTKDVLAHPEGRRPLAARSPLLQHGDSGYPRMRPVKTPTLNQGAALSKSPHLPSRRVDDPLPYRPPHQTRRQASRSRPYPQPRRL